MTKEDEEIIKFLNRGSSTITKEVVVEKPLIKEIEKKCPPCPDCDEDKIISVDTLKIKNDGNIVIKPANDNNTEWIYGDTCEIHTPQEVIVGYYAVTSLNNIEPSHIPPSFSPNPNYPNRCNERNYQIDTQEQGKVYKYANNFNPQFLINDDNTPANGTIIVDEKGIVLGGNGRTMILALVITNFPNNYKKYKELLIKKAGSFGIDITKIENIEFPVLVRIIRTDNNKNCSYYSRIFNENLNNKIDELNIAISYVNSLGTQKVNEIAENIAKAITINNIIDKTTLAEVMNHKEVLPYLLDVLNNAKLINDTNRTTLVYYVGNKQKLTDSAVPIVRNIFFAMILEDRQTILYAKSNPNIEVEKVFGSLVEIKAFDGFFNIIPQLKTAINKIALQQSTTDVILNADDIYSQTNMFEEYRVRYIEYLCMRMLELKKNEQQKVLHNYVRLVKNFTRGIWSPDNKNDITPEKLLEMAFDDAKVKLKLSNLDDGNKKKKNTNKKKAFPCTITFHLEKIKHKKKNITMFFCKAGNENGIYIRNGWNVNNIILQIGIENAFRSFLIKNEYLNEENTLFPSMEYLIENINKKYKTNLKAVLELKNNTYFLKNNNCDYDKEYTDKKHYMPAMFDNKQTIINKITNWIKNDLEKKYRWEK